MWLIIFPVQKRKMFRGAREEVVPGDVSSFDRWCSLLLVCGLDPMRGSRGARWGWAPRCTRGSSEVTSCDLLENSGVRQKGFISGGGVGRKEGEGRQKMSVGICPEWPVCLRRRGRMFLQPASAGWTKVRKVRCRLATVPKACAAARVCKPANIRIWSTDNLTLVCFAFPLETSMWSTWRQSINLLKGSTNSSQRGIHGFTVLNWKCRVCQQYSIAVQIFTSYNKN